MPELAEVETVRRVLKKDILHKKIIDINIYYPKMIENDINDFKKQLLNKEFIDIKRKGKYLLFETKDNILVSHLRMEGKYFIKQNDEEKGKHEHVKFTFDDNTSLRYEDVRKFGRMHLVQELNEDSGVSKQGIEANDDNLNAEYLYSKIHNKNIPIKTLLLDQTIISGLGNIYANEVLYYAKVNPMKLGSKITKEECKLICEGSKKIIEKAILNGGTTIKSYTSSLGVTGHYQDFLKVHKKENESCEVCKSKIIKTKIGGRSTYFCENCQK